jgi:hypothetical protein
MWEFIQSNLNIFGFFIGVLPILGGAVQFVLIRRSENLERQFNTYHRLIKELVQPDESGSVFLDRQIAVLFELQRFTRYRKPTTLILSGLREKWSEIPSNVLPISRLMSQLDETLSSLK